MEAVMIYVTCLPAEAEPLVTALLEQRLVACGNIMSPHRALYWWEGKIDTAQEVAVILKTRADLFDRVREAIVKMHSYACPCIVALPIENGHGPYMDWIRQETRKAGK